MVAFARLLIGFLASWFRSRAEIGAEILILRYQLQVLSRKAPQRPRLNMADRILLVWLYRICPGVLSAVTIVKPETVIRWHRRAFRAYWRWKSRGRPGRPKVAKEIRDLIREMSLANPLWGAPRIHGELRMLGIEVAQSTVSKYMAKRRAPPSQGWKTFLRNHADGIAAIDLFVVPTAALRLLFAFVVLRQPSIVRVLSSDGAPLGAGCLVTDRHVVTCAHVVAEAIDQTATSSHKPGASVRIDFAFAATVSASGAEFGRKPHVLAESLLEARQAGTSSLRPLFTKGFPKWVFDPEFYPR